MRFAILLSITLISAANAADARTESSLSLKLASDFHQALLHSLKGANLDLVYDGPLGNATEPTLEGIETLNQWSICKKNVTGQLKEAIITFTVNTSNETRSEGSCNVDGTLLFIIVTFVSKERNAKSELEELSGKTFNAYLSEIKDLHFKSGEK
jgi:hypothetical protein